MIAREGKLETYFPPGEWRRPDDLEFVRETCSSREVTHSSPGNVDSHCYWRTTMSHMLHIIVCGSNHPEFGLIFLPSCWSFLKSRSAIQKHFLQNSFPLYALAITTRYWLDQGCTFILLGQMHHVCQHYISSRVSLLRKELFEAVTDCFVRLECCHPKWRPQRVSDRLDCPFRLQTFQHRWGDKGNASAHLMELFCISRFVTDFALEPSRSPWAGNQRLITLKVRFEHSFVPSASMWILNDSFLQTFQNR